MKYIEILENFRKFENKGNSHYSKDIQDFIDHSEKITRELSSQDLEPEIYLDRKIAMVQKYAFYDSNLEKLGSGAYRVAFNSRIGEVLKISYTRVGVAQNKKEIESFNRFDINQMAPKVEESDPDGVWLIVERVKPLDKLSFQEREKFYHEKFPKLVKLLSFLTSPYDFETAISDIVEYKYGVKAYDKDKFSQVIQSLGALFKWAGKEITKEKVEEIANYTKNPDKFLMSLVHNAKATNVTPDFHSGNIGLTEDGRYVLLDLGT